MSRSKVAAHRRHDALSGKVSGDAVNTLAPTVVPLAEHTYARRAERRHVRSKDGATLNVPKQRQAPGLNEPYRKPPEES